MILEEATKEAFGYYPSDLKPQSSKPVWGCCIQCGEFKKTSKHDYHLFCSLCSHSLIEANKGSKNPNYGKTGSKSPNFGRHHSDKAKRHMSNAKKGDKNPNFKGGKVKSICGVCGKDFEVKQYQNKKGWGICCSMKCNGKAHSGSKHLNWKGGPDKCICPVCTKEFKRQPSQRNNNGKTCCSRACAAIFQMHNSRPEQTIPEKVFKEICIKHKLPFKCNVDGKQHICNAVPDFIHKTRKIVVEVFGDYWHGQWLGFKGIKYKQTVGGRRQQLKTAGYKLIVFWERDLMQENAEKFVLRELRKEGIY